MKTLELNTESFLFKTSEGQIRAIPFFELSIDEWVIFQNGHPKYFIDFNQKTSSFIVEIKARMEKGEDLDAIVIQIGKYLGLAWTINHQIEGQEIRNSEQSEKVILKRIDEIEEIALELTFIATDQIESDLLLLNDEKPLEKFLVQDNDGYLGLEVCLIDGQENLKNLLNFLFMESDPPTIIHTSDDKEFFDLSSIRTNCIDTDELESRYENWIKISERENTMDEYGSILGIIGYVKRSSDKKYLILKTEKKDAFSIKI
jgi:hypothetical protein